jgi:hypothetical protein
MAKIHTALMFGVQVEISSPLVPSKEVLDGIVYRAQTALNIALVGAVNTTLKLIPGVKVSLTDAKTIMNVEKVEV